MIAAMSQPKAAARAAAATATPLWAGVTVSHDESYRFEALTLLEQAGTRLAEIEAKPPVDSASVGVAVLHPMHLTVKALLAAKGYRAHSTRATVDLLRHLYEGALAPERVTDFTGVQGLTIQGAKSIAAAKTLLGAAKDLVSKGG